MTTLLSDVPDASVSRTDAHTKSRYTTIAHCIFLAVLTYCVHFWHADQYGVYEDDLSVFPVGAIGSAADVWQWFHDRVFSFEFGRPVSFATWILFVRTGFALGGLHAAYALSSLVVLANTVLFYILLFRCYGRSTAIIGAIIFCLFPADTTRGFLLHATVLQPALTFYLIGAHTYLSGRRVLPYVMGFAILFSYESPFLPFLFLPLLRPMRLDRAAVRRIAIHLALCAALIATVAVLRLTAGEPRVVQTSSDVRTLAYRVVTNVYLGPMTVARLFVTQAADTITKLPSARVLIPTTLAFLAFTPLLFTGARSRPSHRLRYPLLLGLLMLLSAYGFAIIPEHYPPTARFGRMTSVHLAAAVGASILFASVAQLALRLADRARLRTPALILLSAYFSILVGFFFLVQHGFLLAHEAQRNFWTQVVRLCPDLDDGTVILLDGKYPTLSRHILNNSWSDPMVLPNLFQFPKSFQRPPILVRIPGGLPNLPNLLQRDGDNLVCTQPLTPPTRPNAGEPLVDGKTIFLRVHGDVLERVSTRLTVDDLTLHFTSPTAAQPYPPGPLHHLFIRDPDEPIKPIRTAP